MAQGQATVKAVLSGDTVILIGSATNGPPPELSLSLSSLQAPRLARNPDQSNEPFAWKSREFLRKLVVGKSVMFKVEYRVPSINRDFGSIWLEGQNVCVRVAADGWAKVKTLEQSRDGHCQDLEEMLRVEQQAVEAKKGIYETESGESTLSVKWSGCDTHDLLETNKGKVLPAVIESFRDGASMRVILMDSLYMINMNLSGVQCPRLNTPAKGSINDTSHPDPFALEAKFFSEVRLLQKDIHVLLEGVDTYGNFYGTIVHKAGNIAVELLKNGLAKMSDWSASYVAPETRSIMRNAERIAKLQHLRLWKDWKPTVIQGEREYTGNIIEVCSGDTVVVFVPGVGERRVSLSSLRAPRLGNARRGEADAPYAWEAKEFLRTKSIGRRAKVSVEYERDPASTAVGTAAQKRSFATIDVFNSKGQSQNIAMVIVREGLAEVIRHRQNDERSAFYDDLLSAETDAKSSRKGIHSGKASGLHRYTDLTADSTKAKQYLPFLRREKIVKGVVQFVSSGTRVKLFIPKENCLINFVVSGIRCPNPERKQAAMSSTGKELPIKAAEPFGDEARIFSRKNLMQRNVEIEVEDMDRGGSAFGALYMTGGGARQNFGCLLLQEGLGMVDEYSVERTRFCAQLKEAQTKAIADKKNIWKNYSKPVAAVEKTSTELEIAPISISEIVNGGHFFIQKTSTNSLSNLEDGMKAFTEQYGTKGATFEPKRGALCAALFTDSSGTLWYRAKVENCNMDGKIAVRFVDYGNSAVVPMSKLRPLDPSLPQLPAQAIESVFRFIKVPLADEEYGHDAGVSLSEMGWSRPLTAKIHGRDELNRLQVSLYDRATSLGEELVRAGLARIDRNANVLPHEKTIYDELLKAQDEAHKNRSNMWQYGDIGSDDEDHLGPWGR